MGVELDGRIDQRGGIVSGMRFRKLETSNEI